MRLRRIEPMLCHFAYLKYVVRHKWFVFLACLRLGVPIWLALWHDMSKFTPGEWFPYVHQFYNPDGTKKQGIRDRTGAYNPSLQPIEFQIAWINHQRNRHHWAAWVSIGDMGEGLSPVPMPKVYVREMVADWMGAAMAQSGKADPCRWYEEYKDKMLLHPETREYLESVLSSQSE